MILQLVRLLLYSHTKGTSVSFSMFCFSVCSLDCHCCGYLCLKWNACSKQNSTSWKISCKQVAVNINPFSPSQFISTQNYKLSGNVIFHPYQKKVNYKVKLKIFYYVTNNFSLLECKWHIKYLRGNYWWKALVDISYRSCSVKYQQTGRNHSKDETLCAILYITKYLPFIDSSSYFLWHNCLGTGCPNTFEQNLSLQKQLIHLMHFAQFKTPAIPLFCSSKLDTVNMIYT